MPPLIRLRDLRKSYHLPSRSLEVLKGIDLDVGRGEFAAIMGSSGSGKSTLLNVLGILDDYDTGTYELDGLPIRDLRPKRAARYRNEFIGFVFQSFNLLPFKDAMENVALPLYYRGVKRRERNRVALDHLERVGLREWAHHRPAELSGGQQQRVAIARSLVNKPKVVLADEPTGALDSETSMRIMDLFREVNKEGITVLVVTHEHDIARRAGRVIRLRDGIIERDGAPTEDMIEPAHVRS